MIKKFLSNTSHETNKRKYGRIYKSSLENEKMFNLDIFGKEKNDYLKIKKQMEKLCI